jgi:hypothetical protein
LWRAFGFRVAMQLNAAADINKSLVTESLALKEELRRIQAALNDPTILLRCACRTWHNGRGAQEARISNLMGL